MRVRVLGPVDVERDGVTGHGGRTTAAPSARLFVLHRGHAVSTDRMVDAALAGQ